MRGRPAIFLDRDGTVIQEVDFLLKEEDVALLPGAAEAIRLCRTRGYLVIVVTNQSAVARGLITESDLAKINKRMEELLAAEGATVDALYYCPHHPDEGLGPYRRDCECRKPRPGMLLQAAAEHEIDLHSSVMVGDSLRDVEAGHRAGCEAALVLTGYGEEQQGTAFAQDDLIRRPDYIASDILQAVIWRAERSSA